MNDFRLTAYRNQYQQALTKLDRLKTKKEGLKTKLFLSDDAGRGAVSEEIAAVDAEYEAMKREVEDLWCLSMTGRHRAEIDRENTIHWKRQYGGFDAHWPGK